MGRPERRPAHGALIIETERLTIEALDVGHAAGLFAALDDERVGRFIGGPDVTSVEAVIARIERVDAGPGPEWDEEWLNWAVLLDGVVIGRIEATLRHGVGRPGVAEIAYVFGPAWWGRGFATEATAWMIDHLASNHGATQWWATVDPSNTASINLLERLGFATTELPEFGLESFDEGDVVFVLRRGDEGDALSEQ